MKIGMISIFPPPNSKHSKMGGVASYTNNLVNSISKNECEITVFANKLQDVESNYIENGVTIKRCWDRGILYPFTIFYNILWSNVDVIHIQHEFFLYGSGISAAMFPILQFLLKLSNKPIIVTIHGIIPLSKLNDEFIEQNKLKGKKIILKTELYWLTKLIVKLSNDTIVHEEKLKDILQNEYGCNPSKINIIHHGIEDRKDLIENDKAKQILGYQNKKIVLFFGYLTGYKGIELLIDAFNYIDDNTVLVIAGGEHPRLKDEKDYRDYIKGLKDKAMETGKNIVFTGFVSEEKIGIYFSAADVVVCPYRVFMASSGPLSLSLSYSKPFIVSEQLKDMINFDDIVFRNDPKELAKKINMILDSNYPLKEYALKLCAQMREKRSWNSISNMTYEIYKNIKKNEY